MSYGLKYYCDHKTTTGNTEITTRIEILQKNYSSGNSEVIGWNDQGVYQREYEQIDPNDIFKEPIQKCRLEFYMYIGDESDLNILKEIDQADEDEFVMRFRVNGVVKWTGKVLPGQLEYSEGPFPFFGKITAKDTTTLQASNYPFTDTLATTIEIIADILGKLGYGIDIHSYTGWVYADSPDDDYLNQIYPLTESLRDFARDETEDDIPITDFEALKRILRANKLLLNQSGGVWNLYHISAYKNPGSVRRFVYNSSGVQQSDSTVNARVSIDRESRFVLPTSNNTFIDGVKQAKSTYFHRSKTGVIALPNNITLRKTEVDGRSFTQDFFTAFGEQNILLSASVQIREATIGDAIASVTIKAGNYYYGNEGWTQTETDYVERLSGPGTRDNEGLFIYSGRIQIQTDFLPEDITGDDLTITFNRGRTFLDISADPIDQGGDFADITSYSDINFDIITDSDEADSNALVNTLTQTGSYSEIYDHGIEYFGDGPTLKSPGRMRYIDGGLIQMTQSRWRFRGESDNWSFSRLGLEEIMAFQRNRIRRLKADLWGEYEPNQIIDYRNNDFFFLGGRQNGSENTWNARIAELNFVPQADSFEANISGIAGTGAQGLNLSQGIGSILATHSNFLRSQRLTITTADLSGTVTTIPIEPIGEQVLEEGKPFYIFSLFETRLIEFIPTETPEFDADIIQVESKTIDTTIPRGSWVIYNQASITSGIIQTNFAIRLFARSNGVGILTEGVSGIPGEIKVNLWTQIRAGQTFTMYIEGEEEPATVTIGGDEGDIYDPGLQTLPLSPATMPLTAPAGTILGLSGTQLQSYFHVDPGKAQIASEKEKTGEGIGRLAEDRSGTITTVALDNIDDEIELLDGDLLRIYNKSGDNEELVVSGDQTLTPETDTLSVVSKELDNDYVAGYAWVREPSYRQTGRLTIQANQIEANVTNISDNTSSVASLTLTVDDNGAAIAALETHTNISGGSSFAALNLRSDIDSAQASLTATIDRVDTVETDAGTIIRSTSQPSQRPSGEALQEGDIWLDPSTYDPAASPPTENTVKQWDGSEWIDFNGVIRSSVAGLELDVDDYRARAMLFTDKFGNVGFIDIESNEEESTINISGDLVDVNNWQFIKSDSNGHGILRSTTPINGNDAIRLNGTTGKAEFEDAVVRGTLTTTVLEQKMTVDGDFTVEDGNIILNRIESLSEQTSSLRLEDNGNLRGRLLYSDVSPDGAKGSGSTWLLAESGRNITVAASGESTITIQLSGDADLRLRGLPTSAPPALGNLNVVYRDASDLRIV